MSRIAAAQGHLRADRLIGEARNTIFEAKSYVEMEAKLSDEG